MSLTDLARQLVDRARSQGRDVLLEHEVYALMQAAGLPVPRHAFVPVGPHASVPRDTGALDGERVIKVVSPAILHKSDVGGVAFVAPGESVATASEAMVAGLPEELRDTVTGVLIVDKVAFKGPELLVGLRRSSTFGYVVATGFGGTAVEVLGPLAPPALTAPGLTSARAFRERLAPSLFFRQATGDVRGVAAVDSAETMLATLERFADALLAIAEAIEAAGAGVAELEINPLVRGEEWLPLDGLLRLGPPTAERAHPDPERLRRALSPERLAVIGASTRKNVGHIILDTVLEGGFDRDHLWAVHPKAKSLSGVPCVASLAELPEPVDLLVVAVGADQVPGVVRGSIDSGKVGGMLLIPGGMGETEGGKGIAEDVATMLAETDDPPVLIGNNSVGLMSRRARFDSLFIPHDKLPREDGAPLGGVALISQSGAFAISRMSKLPQLRVDYLASIGNQLDACISDVLTAVARDASVGTFGLYVEGLQPGDGARLVPVVQRLASQGRDVVVYKGGRSAAGMAAAAGHTASVAGDYRVFECLMTDAGALVAPDFGAFMDLLGISAALRGRAFSGPRTALISNAGYESVGMADHLPDNLVPVTLSDETKARIQAALDAARIGHLVAPTNPLDVTPMAGEDVYEAAVAALLDDPGVDIAVVANVPLTPALRTLPAEGVDREHAWAARMVRLAQNSDKPVIFVIDSGEIYDPLARRLTGAGLAVFRSADRAVCRLGTYAAHRLR